MLSTPQPYSQQTGAPAFMPMAVPNYIAGPPPTNQTAFPAAAPPAPTASAPPASALPTSAPPTPAPPEDGVDPAMEDMAKGLSARDTMADVPSIKEHLHQKESNSEP
ncbi:PDZ domain-containing protein [Trichinella pseudospiralis]